MSESIRLENAVKMEYGKRRINGVNLSICENEHVAVYGAPGSGKSTLMRLIAGIDKPSDGKVFVLGKAVHEMDSDKAAEFRNRNIGIVSREHGFLNQLSVLENVAMPLAVRGMPSRRRKKEAKELLKNLGGSHIAHAYPEQLSDYEAAVSSIARALIAQPKILLLYEASAGLSERETEQLTGTLGAISKYGDYTILSHSINPIIGLNTDRTILLRYGRIQEDR